MKMRFLAPRPIKKTLALWLFAAALYPWVAAGDQAAKEEAQTNLERGVALLRDGQLAKACEQLKAATEQNPKLSEAYIYLGICENQRERFADAISAFHSALLLNEGSEAVHYNLALSLTSMGRINEAVGEFRAVLKLDLRNESANYNLALLLEQQGSFEEAGKFLESARSIKPSDPAVWLHLEDLYLRTGNNAGALQLVAEAIKDDSDGVLSMQIGKLLLDRNCFKEALPALQNAQKLLPDASQNTGYLARAYLGAGQPAAVIELLSSVVSDNASWEVYDLRGLADIAMGQPQEAAEALSKAVEMQPAKAPLHYHLGKVLLSSDDKKGRAIGVNELTEAIRLDPAQSEYYLTLATYYFDTGNMEASIALLISSLNRVPPSVQIYVTLGLAELELHGPTEAEPFIEKAIGLDPEAGAAYDLLGRCRMRVDDYAAAAKYYRKAAKFTPENDIFFRDAAIALEKLGNSTEGVPFAEQSVKLRPAEVYNHYILGKLYSQLGQRTNAVRELETCINLNPKNALPYSLLAGLYKQSGEETKAASCWRALRELKQEDADKEQLTFSRLGSVPQ